MPFILFFCLLLGSACRREEPAPVPPPPASERPADEAASAFAEGRQLQARGYFRRAAEAFRRAAEAEPDNPQYHYYLGMALHAQSRYADARLHFERALALKGDYAAPRIALGKLIYDLEGDAGTARRWLQEALQLAPQAQEARYTLALIAQREGDLETASALYEQVLAADSTHGRARTQLGLVLLQEGKLAEAGQHLRRAVRIQPYEAAAFLGLGQLYLRQGEQQKGQRLLERARQLEEQATRLKPFEDAVRQRPDQPQAHYNLASLYSRFGRLRPAAEHFSRALALDSTYAPAYQGLGNLYQQLGSTPEARQRYAARARALYLRALALDSTLAESHNNLGLILHDQGDVEAAARHYQAAIRLEPERGFYYANSSRAYADLEQWQSAREAARRALELDPSLLGAHEVLGDIAAAGEQWTQALEHWRAIPARSRSPQLKRKIADARQKLAAPSAP